MGYPALIGVGFVTGAYGTLMGAGGGFILMPVLLLLYPGVEQEKLTAISLAVVFFNALSGSAAYAVMRRIDYRSGLMFAAAAVPGSVLGALHTSFISRRLFDIIFGVLLLLLSTALFLRLDIRKIRKQDSDRSEIPAVRSTAIFLSSVHRCKTDADGKTYSYSFNPITGIVLSFFVGYISSFFGIGGGIIHVPALTYLLNFPVHIATATSHFILAIMTFAGALVHLLKGTFAHDFSSALYLATGIIPGAQLGAYLSKRLKGTWIIRSLAVALACLGVRILIKM
jgi:uncharacterized membrane protein YfcA